VTPEEVESAVNEVRIDAKRLHDRLSDSSAMKMLEEIRADSREMWREGFLENEALTIDERGIKKLVSKALEGSTRADAILCSIASRMLTWKTSLPAPLAEHVSKVLQDRFERLRASPRIGRPRKNSMRDEFIFSHVTNLLVRFRGLPATRSEPKLDTPSACSIVAEGFGLSESYVNKIWKAELEGWSVASHLRSYPISTP
jgi:hypothetical protein